jgi:hypothetical protein
MDTFIVRIYRQTAKLADEPAGTIEHVESGDRVGFATARELLDRLLAPRRVKRGAAHANALKERLNKPRRMS